METLSKTTFTSPPQQPPYLRRNHRQNRHPSFSSISFNPQFARPSSISLKIKSSSAHSTTLISANSKTLNPITLLKTPLTIAVAATAIFFSIGSGLKARADPTAVQPPTTSSPIEETENSVVSEEAEKKLEEQVSTKPRDVELLKSLMEAKIKNKKLPEAVEILTKLIEIEPEDMEWPLLRCHMYTYMGESEMAKAGFEEIIAKDPLRVEAFHGLVMAVSQQGEESKGIEEVSERIVKAMESCKKEKRNDDVRDFKLLLAQIRVIEGNYVEALKVYQELVKEEPRDFRPYLCQGIIYTLLRNKDEAEKQFAKYKKLVPEGHPYARVFDDNMLATKMFSQMGENERMKMGSQN